MKRTLHELSKFVSRGIAVQSNWPRLYMHPTTNTAITVEDLSSQVIIQNTNLPSCKDCIFHRPENGRQFIENWSKCTKFGEKNVLTGVIVYDDVFVARKDETKCGFIGKHFQKEPNLPSKIARHTIANNLWYTIPLAIILLNIILRI